LSEVEHTLLNDVLSGRIFITFACYWIFQRNLKKIGVKQSLAKTMAIVRFGNGFKRWQQIDIYLAMVNTY